MPEIFVNIDQIKQQVDVGAIKYESLSPYFQSAETKYLTPYIGTALLNEVKNNPLAPPIVSLLPFLRKAMAHFVLLSAAPDLDINLSETGFTTAANQNLVPASAQRVERFLHNQKELGFTALNDLLSFLNANISNYPTFAGTPQHNLSKELVLQTMNQFQDCVDIKYSWLRFYKILPNIKNVQLLKIAPVISQDYINALINRRNLSTLTTPDKEVLPLIIRAIANYVFAELSASDLGDEFFDEFKFKKQQNRELFYTRLGDHFITEVRKRLLLNTSIDFPEYYNSPQYDSATSFETHENTQDNGAYFFGL